MAKLKPVKEVTKYNLTLSKREAQWLCALVRSVGGTSHIHNAMSLAFTQAGVTEGEYVAEYPTPGSLWINGPKDE